MVISNLRGETETVRVGAISPLSGDTAKEFFMKQQAKQPQLKMTYPVFVEDLLMIIDRRGTIHNNEIFRAILNGYKIDLNRTQAPNSDKDDELISK